MAKSKSSSHFLRDYEASMSRFTDAPEEYHRAAAYTVFGAGLTKWRYRCILHGGVPPRWCNLWVLLIGESGEGRKSTAVRMAEQVLASFDDTLHGPTDGSAEGFLMDWVKKNRNANKAKGASDAASILIQPEFSVMLASAERSYNASLKPILTDLYDVPPLFKRTLAKTEWEIPKPRLSMLGAIAVEMLPHYTQQVDWLGGFFNRALLITAQRKRTMARAGTPSDDVMVGHSDALWRVLKAWKHSQFNMGRPLFDYDKAAAARVEKLIPRMPKEPNLVATLTRASTHLMKCAAIEQIDADPTAKSIGVAAVDRAFELIDHWWRTVPDIIDECFSRDQSDFGGDRLPKRIYRYCLKHGNVDGWVEYAEVMRACALNTMMMNSAVDALVLSGMMEKRQDEDEHQCLWLKAIKRIH